MEQTVEYAGRLLKGVTDIIRRYEETWQKTGEKYNIFTIAGIAHKGVVRFPDAPLTREGFHGGV